MSFLEKFSGERHTVEMQHDPRLNNYRIIGGNSSLDNSTIVFIGEKHNTNWLKNTVSPSLKKYAEGILLSEGDRIKTASLLEAVAKTGDVVLLEGNESLDELIAGSREWEFYVKPYGKVVEGLHWFGWDNLDQNGETTKTLSEIAQNLQSREKLGDKKILARNRSLFKKIDKLRVERNRTMINTISRINEVYPDKRIFVISGPNHYAGDKRFQYKLKRYSHIVLDPTLSTSSQ